MFGDIYKGKNVFITGHTGFKGSWLSKWLVNLGANVTGYSLSPDKQSHFNLLNLPMKSYFADINNFEVLNNAIKESKPDIIFHLAAQPLVRDSYDDPIYTYETNVVGSLKVYKAALNANVPALVSITTDKVYKNHEWLWGYRENDSYGGFDPYSSSKACVELMTDSFKNSFLSNGQMLLATARAGNVIGGGDWSKDRLIPDLVKNASVKKDTPLRNPQSVRPWQHVLEPLSGYLMLGGKLLKGQKEYAISYNFGPELDDVKTVDEVANTAKKIWSDINFKFEVDSSGKHEANLLKLDIALAKKMLNWKPKWTSEDAIKKTIIWYRDYYQNNALNTEHDLLDFHKELAK